MKPAEAAVENPEPTPRTAEELWQQYQAADAALAANPRDVAAQRRCADALCGWLRLQTDGNTVTVDGPGDTPEFRQLWRAHAPRAVELYKALLGDDRGDFEPEVRPRDHLERARLARKSFQLLMPCNFVDRSATFCLQDLCNFIECFSSVSGAKGIAVAALTGDAVVFLRSVSRLKATHAAHNSGLAHIFTAAFYLAAPFPVRSPAKARAAAQEAVACAPLSRRNRYYEGLALLASGDAPGAEAAFALALAPTATATAQSERDIAEVLKREAARGLAEAQRRTRP